MPHVRARASFSICAYLVSVGVIDLDTRQLSSLHFVASAEGWRQGYKMKDWLKQLSSRFGSNRVRFGLFVKAFFLVIFLEH